MTPRLRAQATVEGAFLATVAVLLFLAWQYAPVVWLLGLFCPVALTYVGVRHGLRTATMSAGAAAVLLLGASPVLALLFLFTFGFLGVALGECLRRRLPLGQTAVIGTIVGVLALTPTYAISRTWLGVDPMAQLFTSFDAITEQTINLKLALNRKLGATAADLALQHEALHEQTEYIKLATPAMTVFGGMGMAVINLALSLWLLWRLGLALPYRLFAFATARCYDACAAGLLAGVLLLLPGRAHPWLWVVGLNTVVFFALLYLVQGLLVLRVLFDRWQVGRLWRLLGTLYLVLGMPHLLALAGLLDTWYDFRRPPAPDKAPAKDRAIAPGGRNKR